MIYMKDIAIFNSSSELNDWKKVETVEGEHWQCVKTISACKIVPVSSLFVRHNCTQF